MVLGFYGFWGLGIDSEWPARWNVTPGKPAQRVHEGLWYIHILRAQRGSNIPTLRSKYMPRSYMDPLDCITPAHVLHSRW